LIDWWIDWLIDCFIDLMIDLLICWFIDWIINCWIYWLIKTDWHRLRQIKLKTDLDRFSDRLRYINSLDSKIGFQINLYLP
jgi:hypothetical protein